MDTSTMLNKMDDRVYRTIEDFEVCVFVQSLVED